MRLRSLPILRYVKAEKCKQLASVAAIGFGGATCAVGPKLTAHDLMLGAELSIALLSTMQLHTGYREIDTVIELTMQLCLPELTQLFDARDRALAGHGGP